jgi:hypothetical protein
MVAMLQQKENMNIIQLKTKQREILQLEYVQNILFLKG